MGIQWNSKTAISEPTHLSSPNASIGDMVSSKTVFPIKPSGMTSGLVCLIGKIAVVLCILHFAFCTSVFAAPHISHMKPEPFHHVGKRLSERMKAGMLAPMMGLAPASYPATVKILFLRVDFKPDTDPTTTGDGTWTYSGGSGLTDTSYACTSLGPPISTDPLCTANLYDYWVLKAKARFISYYNEVSYGALKIQVDILPAPPAAPYRLPNTMTTYGADTGGLTGTIEKLVQDAVTAADSTIDFSQYVSPTGAVLIVHAGAGEETDAAGNTLNDIWSLYYSGLSVPTNDGVSITEAIIMPQTDSQDGGIADPLGVYVHEFGHWLGLPDLYDTSGLNKWDGIGKWGLMGDGIYNKGADGISGSSPAHHDAWSKTYLGWVAPQTISTDYGAVTLAPVETNKQIIKLPASTTTPSQYFLLENRQQTGFDSGLPGNGLLVWLIDDDVIAGNFGNNTVNNNPLRPGVKLIEADGNNDLMSYGGDFGGPGDPFPGSFSNTSFTPYTNPSSIPYLGSAWLYIKNIAVSGSNISATIGFAPNAPSGLAASHNSATVLSWTANTEADLAKYKVYRNSTFLAETTQNQYTDMASANGNTYAVTAVDSNGYESAKSTPATVSFATSSGSGGGCFIATAAYGSYEAPYVKILREFRDRYLLTNTIGKVFTELYYKVSPPIADFIRGSEVLRAAVRVLLLPLIGFAAFLVKTTLVQKVLFGLSGALGLFVYRKEK